MARVRSSCISIAGRCIYLSHVQLTFLQLARSGSGGDESTIGENQHGGEQKVDGRRYSFKPRLE